VVKETCKACGGRGNALVMERKQDLFHEAMNNLPEMGLAKQIIETCQFCFGHGVVTFEIRLAKKLLRFLELPLGSINGKGYYHFCPTCGELFPRHHSGVSHDNFDPKPYFAKARENLQDVKRFALDHKEILASLQNAVVNVLQTWIEAGVRFEPKEATHD